jgi:hypothetical protein
MLLLFNLNIFHGISFNRLPSHFQSGYKSGYVKTSQIFLPVFLSRQSKYAGFSHFLLPITLRKGIFMLTDTRIRNAKLGNKPIKLTDGRGLYIEVTHRAGNTGAIATA